MLINKIDCIHILNIPVSIQELNKSIEDIDTFNKNLDEPLVPIGKPFALHANLIYDEETMTYFKKKCPPYN